MAKNVSFYKDYLCHIHRRNPPKGSLFHNGRNSSDSLAIKFNWDFLPSAKWCQKRHTMMVALSVCVLGRFKSDFRFQRWHERGITSDGKGSETTVKILSKLRQRRHLFWSSRAEGDTGASTWVLQAFSHQIIQVILSQTSFLLYQRWFLSQSRDSRKASQVILSQHPAVCYASLVSPAIPGNTNPSFLFFSSLVELWIVCAL